MLHFNNKRCVLVDIAATLLLSATLAGCDQESDAALRAKALQYQQKGEMNAAVITLKNSLDAKPDNAEVRFLLASVYLDINDPVSAEKEVRLAIKQGHPAGAAMPLLGRALNLQAQFQKTIDETQQEVGRKDPALLCVRADAYLALGKLDDARQLYGDVLRAKPDYPPALIGQGRLAFLTGDADAAQRYATQAIAAAPRSTDALWFQGDLLRAQNQSQKALATYDKVLAINPEHRTAHIEKAYLDIALGKFEAAQQELDTARVLAPGNLLLHYTQALLYFSEGRSVDAQIPVHNVLRVAPEHMPTILLAGAVNFNLGSMHQAEHHLRHYLEKNPDNPYARKMLASTLLRTGHTPQALEVLAPALKQAQPDVQMLALAGESYMQARDFNRASQYFEKASALDPAAARLRTSLAFSKLGKGQAAQAVSDLRLATKLEKGSHQAGIALVRTELGLKHFDQAFAAALDLEKEQPDNATVQDLKGMAYLGKGDVKQARASFLKALALQPSYFASAANLAQIELDANNPAGARKHLQQFLDKNPRSTEAMSTFATLATLEKKAGETTSWLERAAAVDPDAVGPAVNLIGQYLKTGQHQKALDIVLRLRVTHPDDPDLLDLLGKGQLAVAAQEQALDTYKKLATALPRSAQAQMQVGALLMVMKRHQQAEDWLKAALAMQPDFPAAQLALAELYVRKNWNELAMTIAEKMQQNHPNAAAGYQLEGDVLMAQHKPALAVAAFDRAFALNRSNEMVIKTDNALKLAGRQEEAARRLAQWLQQHPDDLRVELYRAQALAADQQYKAAAAQFEAIVKRHPDNVIALNNLALVYQQSQDARAQAAAEHAYKVAGDNPVIMDTLGWILVEQGDTGRGLPILQKASAKSPQARDIRYHVALGLFKSGDKAAARKELEALLKDATQFAEAGDARALLKQLQ
ncbi:PEP-CTERM system TPR-repeat protein PrsT [Massilia sp. R2A-15]|uniref:XrtA/PEP-CTERM system TPR-repeat protein PrsT n=1 Tax=Massilia sp. R2A-15 TaxID=3064278 RepID=UPI0027334A89|nr:XrtA/PEP-CTERM system TPR-repeat protein PrsT [Massilia sp. R2A-15]WLI87683.1 PEP-CTERM system TPR-repeat protein PrsT [Massilia sp. R2A-15]